MPPRLEPRELDTLRLTPEATLLRLLAAHAVPVDASNLTELRERMATRQVEVPAALAATVQQVTDMADEVGMGLLVRGLGPLFTPAGQTPLELAVHAWLEHRELFQQVHARRQFAHRGIYQEFPGQAPRRMATPDPRTLGELERHLGTAFEKRGASRHCRILLHQHDDCLVFEVAHGRPRQQRPVITTEPDGATAEDVLAFRPRQVDVVVYDNRTHRLRICAPNAFTIRTYLQAFSWVFFGVVGWFSDSDVVCLRPLVDEGPAALLPTPGLRSVELVNVELRLQDAGGTRVEVVSANVFEALTRLGLGFDVGTVTSAELSVAFLGGGRPRRLKLGLPNRVVYDRSRDERVIRHFLETRGFLAAPPLAEREAM